MSDDKPFFVLVINPNPRQPVYHRHGKALWDDERNEQTGWSTECGKSKPLHDCSKIRRDHAAMIGRPCGVCFPS
jgi:hypothetical protein